MLLSLPTDIKFLKTLAKTPRNNSGRVQRSKEAQWPTRMMRDLSFSCALHTLTNFLAGTPLRSPTHSEINQRATRNQTNATKASLLVDRVETGPGDSNNLQVDVVETGPVYSSNLQVDGVEAGPSDSRNLEEEIPIDPRLLQEGESLGQVLAGSGEDELAGFSLDAVLDELSTPTAPLESTTLPPLDFVRRFSSINITRNQVFVKKGMKPGELLEPFQGNSCDEPTFFQINCPNSVHGCPYHNAFFPLRCNSPTQLQVYWRNRRRRFQRSDCKAFCLHQMHESF
jgi:hypothetical protein